MHGAPFVFAKRQGWSSDSSDSCCYNCKNRKYWVLIMSPPDSVRRRHVYACWAGRRGNLIAIMLLQYSYLPVAVFVSCVLEHFRLSGCRVLSPSPHRWGVASQRFCRFSFRRLFTFSGQLFIDVFIFNFLAVISCPNSVATICTPLLSCGNT